MTSEVGGDALTYLGCKTKRSVLNTVDLSFFCTLPLPIFGIVFLVAIDKGTPF
jgi:hypothetical protein